MLNAGGGGHGRGWRQPTRETEVAAAASMQAREMVREIAAPTTPDGAAEARQTFFN
jgi:hypothetical protein